MFCTLKHTSVSDEAYSFETTAPPFSKKREGKLATVACTNCRISKLKCSGEPHSCQRCLSKKVECQYPSPPRNKTKKKSPSPGTSSSHGGRASVPNVPLASSIEDDFMKSFPSQDTSYTDSLQDLTLGFDAGDFTSASTNTLLVDADYLDQAQVLKPWEQQPFTFDPGSNRSPWDDVPELDDIDFSPESKTWPTAPSSTHMPDQACSCFVQAVSSHETIEVAAWEQRQSSNYADDILQHQKKALVECESLLECSKCSAQPAFIMLLLSMCSKILGALEALCQDGSSSPEASSAEDDTIMLDSGSDTRKRKKNDSTGTRSRSGTGMSILRARQFEHDDERLIIQSLLTARIARLDRLLGNLEMVVSKHSWPAHKDLIRELRNRLTTRSLAKETP